MAGYWTVDMTRCPSCPDKEGCVARKRFIETLSPLTNELNTNPESADGPGDGIVIINCHQPR